MHFPNHTKALPQRRGKPGVYLAKINTLPSNVKDRNTFEIASTVFNNSPNAIISIAGVCD
jgi:hypothetical protein